MLTGQVVLKISLYCFLRVALFLLLTSLSCHYVAADSSSVKTTIKVAKSPWCPYVCGIQEHERTGYITETVEQILTEHGYRIEYVELNFARGVQLVEKGQLDLVLSIFKTESDSLIYNKIPVAFSHNYFFTLANSGWQYSDIHSLRQIRLGAIQGYDYLDNALNNHIYSRQIGAVTMVSGEHPQQRLLQLLQLDRIDTFLDDLVVVRHELQKLSPQPQIIIAGQTRGAEPIYVAVSPHLEIANELIRIIDNQLHQRTTKQAHIQIANRYRVFAHSNGNPTNQLIGNPAFTSLPDELSLNSTIRPIKE